MILIIIKTGINQTICYVQVSWLCFSVLRFKTVYLHANALMIADLSSSGLKLSSTFAYKSTHLGFSRQWLEDCIRVIFVPLFYCRCVTDLMVLVYLLFALYNYFVDIFALPLKSECKLLYHIKTVKIVLKQIVLPGTIILFIMYLLYLWKVNASCFIKSKQYKLSWSRCNLVSFYNSRIACR